MWKKFLPLIAMPLALAGCVGSFTNLTPHVQSRNANNAYLVEVAFNSQQQTLKWDTIRGSILSDGQIYPMRPTKMMTNRWEGYLPVPADISQTHYSYKFEFQYNAMGKPGTDSALSRSYTLKIQ